MLNTGEKGKEINVEKGVTIINQGTFPEFVYWLAEGKLEVFLTESNRTTRIVGQVFRSEFFGEMSAITGAAASASVRT